MDDFRRIQKSHGGCGIHSGVSTYGCSECRRWDVGRNKFKKISRAIAKACFRFDTKHLIEKELSDYAIFKYVDYKDE